MIMEMSEIKNAHEEEMSRCRHELQVLAQEVTMKSSTIDKMHKEHLKEQDTHEQTVAELTVFNYKLEETVTRLKRDMQDGETRYTRELENAVRKASVTNDSLSLCQSAIQELETTIARCQYKETELLKTVESLNEDLHALNLNSREMATSEAEKWSSLAPLLGVDMHTSDVSSALSEIAILQDASLERIKRMLTDMCIRVAKVEDGDHDDQQPEMDTRTATGQMFNVYESVILSIVQSLKTEHEPMEVNKSRRGFEWQLKSTVKRKLEFTDNPGCGVTNHQHAPKVAVYVQQWDQKTNPQYTVASTNQDIDPLLKFKSEVKHEQGHHAVTTQQDNLESSVRERVGGHRQVHTFDIELGDNYTFVRKPIPEYIATDLIKHGAVKMINLGSQNPIGTLLGVLQVKGDDSRFHSEGTPGTCHCAQMKRISEEHNCALFIACIPYGEHEIYGTEHKDVSLYTIVVDKRGAVKSYYLLAVEIDSSYTYNLAKLPFAAHFQPNKDDFVHTADGTCQGHSFSKLIFCSTRDVDTIETSVIILHGDL
ncbi:hypothetical protein DPEC_G00364130 [Dallia pectoralis]|nr:hypothetical protein DPEC_G00364130 [Dallia pectoralis]